MLRWSKLTEWGFYLLLGLPLLVFGGRFAGGFTLFQALTLLVASSLVLHAAFFSSERETRTFPLMPILFLIAWVGYLALQLVPLPIEWIKEVSPMRVLLALTFAPEQVEAGRMPLSLNVHSMWVEVGRLVAYVATFFIAYVLIRDKVIFRRACLAIVVLGTTISVLGPVFHRINPENLYGFISPERGAPITPFTTSIFFANYLVMTIPVTLAFVVLSIDRSQVGALAGWRKKFLWLSSREASTGLIWAAVLMVQLLALCYASSRGGFLALIAALATFLFLFAKHYRNRVVTSIAIGIVVCGLFFGFLQAEKVLERVSHMGLLMPSHLLTQFDLSQGHKFTFVPEGAPKIDHSFQMRLSVLRDTTRMFIDFPIVGIGAGGFRELFAAYKQLPEFDELGSNLFGFAENEPLQSLAETGVVGTGLLLVFGVFLTMKGIRKSWNDDSKTVNWLLIGVVSSLAGMLVHCLSSFATHISANMALFAVLAGVLTRLIYMKKYPDVSSSGRPKRWFGALGQFLWRAPLVAAALFFLTPLLWHQWTSEYFYVQGEKILTEMERTNTVSRGPVEASAKFFERADQAGHGQGKIKGRLGRIHAYRGILEFEDLDKRAELYEEAVRLIKEAIRLNPFDSDIRHSLGWVKELRGEFEEASIHFRKATQLRPQKPSFYFELGRNELRIRNKQAALDSFRNVLGINQAYFQRVVHTMAASGMALEPPDWDHIVPEGRHQKSIQKLLIFYAKQEPHLGIMPPTRSLRGV